VLHPLAQRRRRRFHKALSIAQLSKHQIDRTAIIWTEMNLHVFPSDMPRANAALAPAFHL
jgi:hypothetical protein